MEYAIFPGDQKNGGASGALVRLDVAKPGGKVIRHKQDIGDFGFIALIEDTEGNMIGLRSVK